MKKFFGVIGNPPYQEETEGTSDKPIYDKFMNSAFEISERVELITPARFLFNAGKTPKAWNKKRLHDPFFKVLYYEPDSTKVFPPPTDIKGGIAVTYRDETEEGEAIEVFTSHNELNTILKKVKKLDKSSFDTLVFTSDAYRFTEAFHKEYPEVAGQLSAGHEDDLVTNIFETVPFAFSKSELNDCDCIKIYGRDNSARVFKYINQDYIKGISNFHTYKVFLPKSNGSGAFGETLSSPIVAKPLEGHTQTFISIGEFGSVEEAEACLKYVKTKFTRTMLGVLKVTQHNPSKTWKYVPLQDFTSSSDIDWSQSVHEIDVQLYKKYGLSDEEIEFIEIHVKEMD